MSSRAPTRDLIANVAPEIPAFAGMTNAFAGMTNPFAGMTKCTIRRVPAY